MSTFTLENNGYKVTVTQVASGDVLVEITRGGQRIHSQVMTFSQFVSLLMTNDGGR